MTRETAIHLAKHAAKHAIRECEHVTARREKRNGEDIWVVMFVFKENEDVVISPNELVVEVNERTHVAAIVLNP